MRLKWRPWTDVGILVPQFWASFCIKGDILALHKELKKMTEEIQQLEIGVTEGIRMTNWNDIIPVRKQ